MNQERKRGRPPTSPSDAAARKARWDHAVSFSGLRHDEIAVLVGRSLSRVRHYCSRAGAMPPEGVIETLEAHCRDRVEREAERLRASPSAYVVTAQDIEAIRRGRAQVADGDVHDMDDVLAELDDIISSGQSDLPAR